jgi:hypothetical protein
VLSLCRVIAIKINLQQFTIMLPRHKLSYARLREAATAVSEVKMQWLSGARKIN